MKLGIKPISLNQAAKNNISAVRMSHWANKNDHIKIDIIDGKVGPWGHLYSESNEKINGRNPVDFLLFSEDLDAKVYLIYHGAHT
jgi:hypothetical protein